MIAIVGVIAVITANRLDALPTKGLSLLCEAIIHNLAGYMLGYGSCKLMRLQESDYRTIAFEVGMQNGGLTSCIVVQIGSVVTLGLAPVIFGPRMNVKGACLLGEKQ